MNLRTSYLLCFLAFACLVSMSLRAAHAYYVISEGEEASTVDILIRLKSLYVSTDIIIPAFTLLNVMSSCENPARWRLHIRYFMANTNILLYAAWLGTLQTSFPTTVSEVLLLVYQIANSLQGIIYLTSLTSFKSQMIWMVIHLVYMFGALVSFSYRNILAFAYLLPQKKYPTPSFVTYLFLIYHPVALVTYILAFKKMSLDSG